MLIEAMAQRVQQDLGNGVTVPVGLTMGLASLKVAQAEGEGDYASTSGLRYHMMSSAATGIAPVQALPTTAAQWLLYNPAGSDDVVFIDELGAWDVSGVAGAGGTLLYGICGQLQLPTTRPNSIAAGIVLANANPNSKKSSRLLVVSAATLAASPGWKPLAWMNPANTALGETQMVNQDVRGKIILPPDTGVALAVISPTGTSPLFAPMAIYREYSVKCE